MLMTHPQKIAGNALSMKLCSVSNAFRNEPYLSVEKDNNCVLSAAKPLIQLGTNITLLRDAMSLSRDTLAEIVGSSASHIAKLERGKTECPGYFVIENLARFFGVTTTQLVNDDLSLLCSREQAVKRVIENFSDDEWRNANSSPDFHSFSDSSTDFHYLAEF